MDSTKGKTVDKLCPNCGSDDLFPTKSRAR